MSQRLWVRSSVAALALCVGIAMSGKLAEAQATAATVGLLAYSVQTGTIHESKAQEGNSFKTAKSGPALSLLDILGIVLFLALIGAHFWMCRSGVYPESSCFCEAPPWLRRLAGRIGRKLSDA